MLSRFREAQALELGLKTGNQRRPHRASDCNNRHDAERWRQQVIREISKKISQIQNRTHGHWTFPPPNPGPPAQPRRGGLGNAFVMHAAALGDYQVRDINDEINKLLREKGHWEVRIRELGGPDYFVSERAGVRAAQTQGPWHAALTFLTSGAGMRPIVCSAPAQRCWTTKARRCPATVATSMWKGGGRRKGREHGLVRTEAYIPAVLSFPFPFLFAAL